MIAPGTGEVHTRRFDWQATLGLLRRPKAAPTSTSRRCDCRAASTTATALTRAGRHQRQPSRPDRDHRRRAGGRLLRVMDLKRGEALHLTHRVQVLCTPWNWKPSCGPPRWTVCGPTSSAARSGWAGSRADAVRIGRFAPHLENFLRQDLMRILRGTGGPGPLACPTPLRMVRVLRPLPGRDAAGQRSLAAVAIDHLRQVLPSRRSPDGQTCRSWVSSCNVRTPTRCCRCASLAGRRPRLTQQVVALETDQPQTHGAASPSLSKGENIGLFLTLQQEPLAQSVYLAGIHLTMRKDLPRNCSRPRWSNASSRRTPRSPVLLGRDPADVTRIAASGSACCTRLSRKWTAITRGAVVRSAQPAGLRAHRTRAVPTGRWLLESLQDADQPALAEQAMTLLFHFQAPELMVADSIRTAKCRFR